MMTARSGKTLLERLAEENFPLKALQDAAAGNSGSPLAKLMLQSAEIERRAAEPWRYKSLAHFGEEEFISRHPSHYLFSRNDQWLRPASQVFAESVYQSIWHEEHGLLLYVADPAEPDGYRKAQAGDSAYDFVRRLCSEGMLSSDLRFTEAPQWARELFLFRPNYEAYRLAWDQPDSMNDLERVQLKRDMVLRETEHQVTVEARAARLVEPFVNKDMIRLRDVADLLNAKLGFDGTDAIDYVTVLVRMDDTCLCLADGRGIISAGPVSAKSQKGRDWTRSLFDDATRSGVIRQFGGVDEAIAEKLCITLEDADRLFSVGQGSVSLFTPPPGAMQAEARAREARDEESDLDPSDLPDELDVAMQAFRAVHMGYGSSTSTFRNRVMAWLEEHRPDLGQEARDRIATVANRDKAPGRRPARE